jgi:hypothetical protein
MVKDFDPDDDIMVALHDAMREGRIAAESAAKGVATVLANQLAPELSRQKQARELAAKTFDKAARKFDAATQAAQAEFERIEKATRAPEPPKSAADIVLHSEVRQALARMPHDQRAKTISDALIGDDDESKLISAAVLTGGALLSGLGSAELELKRASWRKRHFSAQLARAERIKKALDATHRGAHLLRTFCFTDLSPGDPDAIARAEASEKAAAEALAAAG